MTYFWNHFFDALIPICICVVLPSIIIWLIGRVKQNETNRRAEIMLKALDNGAKINTDFFKSQSASRTIKERLKKCVDEDRHRGRVALIIALGAGLVLGCLATLLVLFYPLPSIEANSSALARAVAGLQEWKEFLIALIAGCAIALGVVFMSRKKEAL